MSEETKNPVTTEQITAEFKSRGNIKIEWDRNSTLDKEGIEAILKGQDSIDEYEQKLVEINTESFHYDEQTLIKSVLEFLHVEENGLLDAEGVMLDPENIQDYAEELCRETNFQEANLEGLARNSGGFYFTVRKGEPSNFQSWRGLQDYEDIREICEILNISPHHFQGMVPEGDELILETIPEREGKEFVSIKEWATVFEEATHGGELCFMLYLEPSDILSNPEGYTKGPLRICKGTLVTMNDYLNGATACHEAPLLRDLDLPAGSYTLHFDQEDPCGIQQVCMMTATPWKKGHATPLPPEKETPSGEN